MFQTRVTLLKRLKHDGRDVDWEDFYDMYGPVILRYARKIGLDDDHAVDVLQETMIILMRKMTSFEYDPKRGLFRNYLLTIVHRCALRSIRRTQRRAEVSADAEDDQGLSLLDSLAAPDDGARSEQQHLWRQSVLENAIDLISADESVKPQTLDAFVAYTVHGHPAKEVAANFGITENALYQIRNRMIGRIRREIAPFVDAEEDA